MRRRLAWLALLLVVAGAVAIVIAPAWLIQPFRHQTPRGIAVSFTLRRFAPIVTAAVLLASGVLAAVLWRRARPLAGRIPLVLCVALAAGAAWIARQNHFEWMFAPLEGARFAPVSDAPFMGDADLVLAVTRGADSAAYPVRQLAYHHVVQDVVGGVSIVVTY